ncbi:caspase, EACC1-associated type [Streptomyces sp. LaPpAH-108]|uniref:caspase, EACC1-associated type n=1 Tax=Streptomyces sp. LaPpAH-108 TaxID=1155714 RepID=UPI00037C8D05|nr:AAA family ATPase [Streptomyces sp. LaPpAH-108]
MTGLSGEGVRVLLIGTENHPGPTLTSVPAVSRTVEALRHRLTTVCGVAPGSIRTLLDPADARTMAAAVAEEAQRAHTVLLIHYVGHGLIGPGDELHLAASSTDRLTPGLAAHQALSLTALRQALTLCRAPSVVVVLDCCFSGRAGLGGPAPRPAITLPAAHGVHLLASAEQLALAPEDAAYTTFTGELIRLLDHGDPRGPRLLTLDAVYDFLFRSLRAKGGPLPRRQAGDRSGELVFAVNPAQPVAVDDPDPPDGDNSGTAPSRCPYLGLEAFAVDDADLFHGRERLVEELLETSASAMAAGQPVVVVGPSGAGKTSLLHAGLLAALGRGTPWLPGSGGWPWLVLTPGDDPLGTLAAVLGAEGPDGADALAEVPSTAAVLARRLLQEREQERLVLVVDRLEELFTAGERERTAFCAALAALAGEDGRALVVLALRADFYGQAQSLPHLAEALRRHQVQAAPMRLDELRAAIERPAATVGVRLDEGLADLMLHELDAVRPPGPRSGTLPLLSHALWATWAESGRARLTVAGYRASGGVATALRTTAERVYDALDPAGRTALRRMMPRLVRIGDGTVDTGRPAERDALLDGVADRRAAEDALHRMARARLVVLHESTVRLGHDALLTAWPRLHDWIEADRDWLRPRQQLAADTDAWLLAGRDRDLLYRGTKLAAAVESADRAARDQNDEPRLTEFLDASVREEKRAARTRNTVISILVVLLLIATGGGITATVYQHEAASQRGRAVARLMANEAVSLRDTQPGLAKQLSVAAYRLDPELSVAPLLSMLETPGVYDGQDNVVDLARTGDGRLLALSTGRSVVLWRTPGGRLATVRLTGARGVALSPDGRLLAALASTGESASGSTSGSGPESAARKLSATVRLWSLADPAKPVQLPLPHGLSRTATALAFSSDGHSLALGTASGAVRRWDLRDTRAPRSLPDLTGPKGPLDSLAFAPVGHLLAASGADGRVRLWDTAEAGRTAPVSTVAGAPLPGSTPLGVPHRVAFRPDGAVLAGPGEGVRLWKVSDPRKPEPLGKVGTQDTVGSCQQALISAAFSPDGHLLATPCGTDLHLWDVTHPAHISEANALIEPDAYTSGPVPALFAPSRDPVILLHATATGVHLWDVTKAPRPGAASSLGTVPSGFGLTTKFSGGPRRLLVAHGADRTVLWDMSGLPPHRKLADLPGSGDIFAGAAEFSPDGKVLAEAERAGDAPVVRLRDTAHPTSVLSTLRSPADGVESITFSADGRVLAVSDTGYSTHHKTPPAIRLFDVSRPERPRRLAVIHDTAFHLAFSPRGRLLVGSFDDRLLLWDISDARHPVAKTPRLLSPGSLDAVPAFRRDGRLLAVSDSGNAVRLWRVEHGDLAEKPVGEIRALGTGGSLAFTPDGRTLAVASTGTLRSFTGETLGHIELWDVTDPATPVWRASFGYNEADLGLGSLSYSPQGRTHYLASASRVLAVWNTDPRTLADQLCQSAGDPISKAEWKRYAPDTEFRAPCPEGKAPAS